MGRLSGVDEYVWATVRLPFPKGEENCWTCPLLNVGRRMVCNKTGEIILYEKLRGHMCPLEFEEEENDGAPGNL